MKNMKKIFAIGLVVLSFTACGSAYQADRSYMTEEQKTVEQQKLDEASEKYKNAKDEKEKTEAASSIGLRNMNLGNYDEAIKYYEEVLEAIPNDYAAANNLSVMYEEMGDFPQAIEYIGVLYDYYTDRPEVNNDFVRLLVANKQFVEAQRVIDAFKKTERAKDNEDFIKSLEEMTTKAQQNS